MSIERTDVNVQMLVNECAEATRRHLEALMQVYLKQQRGTAARQVLGEVIDGLEITADKLEQLENKA